MEEYDDSTWRFKFLELSNALDWRMKLKFSSQPSQTEWTGRPSLNNVGLSPYIEEFLFFLESSNHIFVFIAEEVRVELIELLDVCLDSDKN